ncbi:MULTISPECIES: xanthine dehydrogenase family protein molybdopterin-binding subunit [Mycobacteriaceae]|uniref:Aldehyde oxidase n=1 Tax=Mycolicibacterium neoaurum VKM Ac-1815D TaxID=700508 RepID=V5XAT4_MYCNE|nr:MULTISPECIES: xanthine dehydrogenase family protein molybdopterin-binding subunit [Mycobacteriaceae]AHC24948.1 aldehyde oxidase [Mycolicibacterium neoaurum VKM Ac-1815D]AMO05481.1 aldehyde oxidase [Mycolicibacterium neoaurum]AXK76200.1 xanthine dehydrogenase family protein molybdopterin-binding subunit [Mycolicibacterium neoaurum]KJQ50675.1 aldehyde oxidase [Mycolicibacterium neoaurum]KUM09859.1 aldehyde oxidase [Mycolicibacterium neoaurum]
MTAQIGRPIDRVEGREKVTGAARYTADHPVSDLAYAVLVQSEVAHATVTAESVAAATARAAAAPGVLYVLTPLNCPPLHVLPEDLTWDLPLERRPPLSDLTVQHVGQHLAVVVAETMQDAVAAADLMEFTYRDAPAQLSAAAVMAQPVPPDQKDGQIRHGTYRPDHFVKLDEEKLQDHRGSAVEPSGVRVAGRFTTPVNTHYPIELAATIASWDGEDLTVYDATRWITGERRALAAYLGIDEDRVRILSPLVGGAFGSKSFLWMHVVLCAVAAKEVGRPVKLVLTRGQMFTSTGHRPRTEQHVALVADDDGTLLSTEQHTVTETSTVAHFCEPVGLSARFLYHSPRMAVSHTVARINAPTPCFMRGPGEAPGLFALEVAMDELADELGVDPVALRMSNDPDTDQPTGRPWSGKHLRDCYLQGAERFGWADRPSVPRAMRRNGVQVGWGMATASYPGRRMPAGCRVTTTDDGRVRFAVATHEIGTGVRTVMTQIAADATGLPLDALSFESGDSAFADAPYSGASQTTATVGSAVDLAGRQWRQRLGCPVTSAAELRDVLAATPGLADRLSFTAVSDGPADTGPLSQSFGAHFCEVEVDEEIGRASVTRWTAVMDCGRVLNPKLATNQVMGGIIFGLGMALLEQVPFDENSGVPLGEYYVPTHADIPDFDITFIDTPDYGLDPVGVRGIGEIGTCGVPAAIANAIYHATGKRIHDLPITVESLLEAQP